MTASVRWGIVLLLPSLGFQVRGANPGEADARLRATLRTPAVQVTVQFGFDVRDGLEAWEPASDRAGLMKHLATTGAICMALAGEPDQAENLLKQVLQQFPQSDDAGSVQRILGAEPGSLP